MTVWQQAFPNGKSPQRVLVPPSPSAIFLVLTVRPGFESRAKDFLSEIAGLTRTVGFRSREADLSCVTGIGADLWARMFTAPRPRGLHPFIEQRGDVHTAPSTPGDLLFHIRARRIDMCFELARLIGDALQGAVDVADEVHGFRYFDERDILGFVDGTENPEDQGAVDAVFRHPDDVAQDSGPESILDSAEAGAEVGAVPGDGAPGYPGSTFVIVQKYTHDMAAWDALSVEEQEAAFGRHKLSDVEFAEEDKAPNSHLVLNSIEDEDGNDREIVRDNMVFGSVGSEEYGTYFIAYAADVTTTEQMLTNMFIGDPVGTYDRILDFSTAVTGGLFFVPSQDFLDDPDGELAEAGLGIGGAASAKVDGPDIDDGSDDDPVADEPTDSDDPTDSDPSAPTDGSLGIGSLNRRRQ
ncbi:Dyp-type peroxidase [Brevibacterium sediminis]|uniref:Dyp-type peroxidase n=1 Tax=Brevibacterium sediminis TaxID=1857024 RepID=A0A5C4X4B5_9MICO|nr:Dyp-type peroxidase [Brevibacterium sediminis]TNM56833.1 Dyp-type peroxidase [Brevibacterium sediminis]